MATIYWAGGTDTDIDDFNNYVTSANGTSVISDNSGDFSGDDVVFQSLALSNVARNPTVNANETFNAIKIDSGCTLTGNASYSITVDSESDFGVLGALHAVYIAGTLGTNVNVIIACAVVTSLQLNGSSGNLHNVTVSAGSSTHYMVAAATIAGNLTITSGTLTTGSDYALTVAGDVSVTGTLTGNASAISMGSLTIESAGTYTATSGTTTFTGEKDYWCLDVKDGGTFTHSSGTVNVTTNTNTIIRGMEGDDTSGSGANALNNLTVTLGSSDYRLELDQVAGTSHTIKGDVTVAEGHFRPDSTGHSLIIEGDVSIESGGTLGATNRTGDHTFGSLTIASGGTYSATSGTTTITGKNSSDYMFQNSGTFTHNKGTVKFKADTSSGTWAGQNSTSNESTVTKFYNFETEATGSASSYRFWYGGNSFYLVVLNDLTIGAGSSIFSANGTSKLRHYGSLFNINGAALFDNVTDVQCGLITIGTAGVLEIDNGDQAISCTGIRNLRGSAGIQA